VRLALLKIDEKTAPKALMMRPTAAAAKNAKSDTGRTTLQHART